MPYTPEQYYFDFSNDFCDSFTNWGVRGLTWGKGAAWDMEGFAHLLKMLPYPCYTSYRAALTGNDNWQKKFSDFYQSGKDKLAMPYKFLQNIDPDAFKEIQQTHFHSVAHAVRNAGDLSRACDLFYRAKYYNNKDIFYEWEGRGATEVMFHFAKNSLVKSIILSGIDILPTGENRERFLGGPNIECGPSLLGGTYACVCPPIPGVSCPPTKKQCVPGGDFECSQKTGLSRAICANEPWPSWPTGDAPLGSGFATDPIDGYRHAGYFVRKSYDGYTTLVREAGELFATKDIDIFINWAHTQNGFNYRQTSQCPIITDQKFYTTNRSYPLDTRSGQRVLGTNAQLPVKRLRSAMKINSADEARDFLYNGYGIVLSTNVGFSKTRDSIGLSYPDRLWYHTMAIIGYDDTRRLHPDCLFLIQNSWGNWNSGGHPDWGPLPEGSFLITATHLNCILTIPPVERVNDCNEVSNKRCFPWSSESATFDWNRPPTSITDAVNTDYDWAGDRSESIRYARLDCNNKRIIYTSEKACERAIIEEAKETDACGDNCYSYTDCDYQRCGSNQSPWGIAFALSFDPMDTGPPFKRKDLRYEQFFIAKKYSREVCINNAVAIGKCSWNTESISNSLPSIVTFNTTKSFDCEEGVSFGQQYGRIDCFIDMPITANNKYVKCKIEGKITESMFVKLILNEENVVEIKSFTDSCDGETVSKEKTFKLKPGRNLYSIIVDAGLNNIPEGTITFTMSQI